MRSSKLVATAVALAVVAGTTEAFADFADPFDFSLNANASINYTRLDPFLGPLLVAQFAQPGVGATNLEGSAASSARIGVTIGLANPYISAAGLVSNGDTGFFATANMFFALDYFFQVAGPPAGQVQVPVQIFTSGSRFTDTTGSGTAGVGGNVSIFAADHSSFVVNAGFFDQPHFLVHDTFMLDTNRMYQVSMHADINAGVTIVGPGEAGLGDRPHVHNRAELRRRESLHD